MSPRHRAAGRRRSGEAPGGTVAEGRPGTAHDARTFTDGADLAEESRPVGRRRFARARTIRARLAIILSVPTVLLVALAVSGLFGQVRVSARADAAAESVELVLTTQELIHSLQRERGLTSGLLGGAGKDRPLVAAQRRTSDRARTALDRLLAGPGFGPGTPNADAVRTALTRLAELGSVRGSVDAGRLSRQRMLDFYTTAITALNRAPAAGDVGEKDQVLRRQVDALTVLGDAKEATALERGQLNGVFAQGAFRGEDYLRFTEVRATKLESLARFSRLAAPDRWAALESALRTPEASAAAAYEQQALAGARGQRLNVSPARWWSTMTTVVDDMRGVQQGVGADLRDRARQLRSDAARRLAAYAAGAVLALLIALLLWFYTFRSIVRPLRALAGEANEAALRRLPAAVARIQSADPRDGDPQVGAALNGSPEGAPGGSSDGPSGGPSAERLPDPAMSVMAALVRREDEFAEVAEALGQLQRTAVRLAVEQAVMRRNTAESLASLGRRNQNLVRRQLGFITVLERDEADPNQLANLFELDHLATRMRRNAESLLVLVGEQSPRRANRPVPVGDVLRSAFAEVEDYRRVVLRRVDDAEIKGSAAAEVAHLLAELVENALACSPPDQEVEVQARGTGSQYHIAIVDQGIGMTPDAMATANARLRGEQSFLVAPTRDLGHYVVGRLADRLGIDVWLHDSPLNGVTARVVLPESLLHRPDTRAGAAPGPADGALAGTADTAGAAAPGPGPGPGFRPEPGPGPVPVPVRDPVAAGAGPAAGAHRAASRTTTPRAAAGGMNGHIPSPSASTASTASAATSPVGGRTAGPATTRNGLVKRQPGETALRRPVRPAPRGGPPQRPAQGGPAQGGPAQGGPAGAPGQAGGSGPARGGGSGRAVAPAQGGGGRSPADVRSMLNDFRTGVNRAERNRSGEPG